jgi:hypothetical protein
MGPPLDWLTKTLTSTSFGIGLSGARSAVDLGNSFFGSAGRNSQANVQSLYGMSDPLFGQAQQRQADAIEAAAKAQEMQAQAALEDAQNAATQKATEVRQAHAHQAVAYASSGVTLEGSPLLVLNETLRLGQQEVDALMKRGTAQANLYNQAAFQTRNEGRAALLGQQSANSARALQTRLAAMQNQSAANPLTPLGAFADSISRLYTTRQSVLGNAQSSKPLAIPPATSAPALLTIHKSIP